MSFINTVVTVSLVTITLFPSPSVAQTAYSAAAVVAGTTITNEELDTRIGDKLLRLKTDEFNLRRAALDSYIEQLMLTREAEARHMTVAELVDQEVTRSVPAVTETESRAAMDAAAGTFGKMPEAQALRASAVAIQRSRIGIRRQQFLGTLRAKYPSEILLEAPRLSRSYDDGQSVGPGTAPIVIVEFSDFQCPFCAQLTPILDRLRREYPTQVRLQFKQFPLPIHAQAVSAAEAALCAAKQGRFWQMHDIMFGEQRLVTAGDFAELARRSELDLVAFGTCVNSHENAEVVRKDRSDGDAAGVSGTPTTFIDGQMVVGLKSYDFFKDIIETQLHRVAGSGH